MSPKNGNTVALERRMDLASLFCMISRHGPAVVLTVIAVASVLAGFIIYRSVRGKRRKATAGGDVGDGSSSSKSPGAERDAALSQAETCPEGSRISTESTGKTISAERLLQEFTLWGLKIRHRRAAADRKPPPDLVPDEKHGNASAAQHCYEAAETYAEEASQRSDTCTVAEVAVEDDEADWHQRDTRREAEEERDEDGDGRLEPELVYNGSYREEEKVLPAKCQEDADMTADKDVYDEKSSREEECVLESLVHCEQTTYMRDDNRRQDNEATPDTNDKESHLDEPVVHMEDVSCMCSSKEFEEENQSPEDTGHSNKYSNYHFSTDEEIKNEKVDEAFVDDQVIAQQAEIVYLASEQETNLPSSQQDQFDDAMEEVVQSSKDSGWDADRCQASEAIQEDVHEDLLSNLIDVAFDAHRLQQQLQTEQKNENDLTCNEEDDVVKSEMLCDSSSVAPLASLNMPFEPEMIGDGPCVATTDANVQISGTADFPDLSSDYQQSQSEVKGEENPPTLDEDADIDVPAPDLPSLKEEIQSEKNEIATVMVLAQESADQEANLPSSQLEQCNDVKAEVVLSCQDSERNDVCGLTGEATEEGINEGHLNDLTNTAQQELEVEQQTGLTCSQEDGAVKGEMLASCDEEPDSSSAVLEPALPERFDPSDDGLCGATTDAKAQTPGTVVFPDLSSDYQQPQSDVKEEEIAPVLNKVTDLDVLAPDLLSPKDEIQCENQGCVDQKANLPSSQLNQCDEVTAKLVVSSQESDRDDDRGVTSKATEEDINGSHLNNLSNVGFDAQTLEQQLQIEQKNGLPSIQDDGVVEGKMLASCHEECQSSSVVLVSVLPEKIDNGDDGLCADSKAQIPGADFPELSSDYQQPQVKEDEIAPVLATDLNILSHDLPSLKEENQSGKNETNTAVVLAEEIVKHIVSSCYKDQQSDPKDKSEPLDKMGANPATDTALCDEASFAAPVMSTEISHLDIPSSFQDKQSDQMQNNAGFPEVTTGAGAVMTESNTPPVCQIQLPSFEQSELTWSCSFGGESGISSMAVSPDLENPVHECLLIPENAELPVADYDPQFEVQTEAQINLFADDVALSVVNEDAEGMVSESCPSHLSQPPQSVCTDWANDASFSSNEDTFGNEIEDSYNRAMDEFALQVAAEVAPHEKKMQTNVKAVETKKKKKKKEGAKEEEEEEEEDYEKTEISIMEATMDHNEWITEGNYQVLPWMNLSVPSFSQSHTKTDPVPSEELRDSSSPADAPCIVTDIPVPSIEVKEASPLPLVDENTESSKKVVAVQPMPQNVNVTFRIHYHTQSPYQKVAITGDQQELGNWKEFIPLERAKDGHWSTVISLPAESHVEWKFVVVDKGDVCRWEECGNRLLATGSGDDLLVHKWWGML